MTPIDFTLQNIRARATVDPRHFVPPSQEQLENLQIGDEVQLNFLIRPEPRTGFSNEKLWVRLTKIEHHVFTGELIDEPALILAISRGDLLQFRPEHITEVRETPLIDPQLTAIITPRALSEKTINYAVKHDQRGERDSGWQFFYGDEAATTADDPQAWQTIVLAEALYYEPRLKFILAQNGTFTYSSPQAAYLPIDAR